MGSSHFIGVRIYLVCGKACRNFVSIGRKSRSKSTCENVAAKHSTSFCSRLAAFGKVFASASASNAAAAALSVKRSAPSSVQASANPFRTAGRKASISSGY